MESMSLAYRFRLPAVLCSLALLGCELISHPFAEMGICDDWSYLYTAHHLAASGHIVYIGWAAAMLGWQLYLGALFIKLFGYSHTSARMATLLIAMAAAFLMQRSISRALAPSPQRERNATIGTLALVLSPLFLELSVTFMSDIYGVFAIIVCLYACLRALQASNPNRVIAWICLAVVTNAIGGSARQVAWLGVLVMVPSTLWLRRSQRRIVLAGAAATVAGVIFVFACMRWFQRQPYSLPSLPENFFTARFPLVEVLKQFTHVFMNAPFLLLPLFAIFIPPVRTSSRRTIAVFSVMALIYVGGLVFFRHSHHNPLFLPSIGDWVTVRGIYDSTFLLGTSPLMIRPHVQILLTIVSMGGVFGLIALLTRPRSAAPAIEDPGTVSWMQLAILLGPFTLASLALLIPVATSHLMDRYMLGLLVVLTLCLVRLYQDRVQARLPSSAFVFIICMAVLGIAMTHNTFSLYRARIALAAELRSAGVPATSVDSGWESNMSTEIQFADHINYGLIVVPRRVYVPVPVPVGPCNMMWYAFTPHVRPVYSISFSPDACAGPAPFAPVHYSQWLVPDPGTLYVVKFNSNAHSTP